ncbi:hypothetical protein B0H14DRAFT_3566611 [Mycena olivaceomarginata]|nr:hypothetical protein B0H14DRAFT_3566611 [Mycena olivaceomarginata]
MASARKRPWLAIYGTANVGYNNVLTTEYGFGPGGPMIRDEEKDMASGVAPDPIPSGLKHTAAPLKTPQASLAPVPADTVMGHPTQNFAWANQLKTTSLCPPYQCHKDLLDDFSARLHFFIDTQAYRSHMGFPALQVMFDFSGEYYSIVAADYDMPGRKVAVDVRVDGIEDSVASVTGLTFGPRSFYVRPYGVITRLCCFKMLHPLPATHALLLYPRICSASWRYLFSRMSPTGIFLERRPLSVFGFSGEQ